MVHQTRDLDDGLEWSTNAGPRTAAKRSGTGERQNAPGTGGVLVTGAGSGLGLRIAELLGERGRPVIALKIVARELTALATDENRRTGPR